MGGRIRGTEVGCAVCNGGSDIPQGRAKRPFKFDIDRDKFFNALADSPDLGIPVGDFAAPAQAEQEEAHFAKLIAALMVSEGRVMLEDTNAAVFASVSAHDELFAAIRRIKEQRDAAQRDSEIWKGQFVAESEIATTLDLKLSTAEARVRELEADAKRLDWLEANDAIVNVGNRLNTWNVTGKRWLDVRNPEIAPCHVESLREAIDRASTDREQNK